MSDDEAVNWVRKCLGYNVDYDEAIVMYNIYRSYRDEGQSHEVSKQYAGLM